MISGQKSVTDTNYRGLSVIDTCYSLLSGVSLNFYHRVDDVGVCLAILLTWVCEVFISGRIILSYAMAQIEVEGETLDVEVVSSEADVEYVLEIFYRTESGRAATDEIELDIEGRNDLTMAWIEQRLAVWKRDSDAESIVNFAIRSVDVARRGSNSGVLQTETPPKAEEMTDSTEQEVSHPSVSFTEGEKIVYYVDGPESAVYGYKSEAVVVEVPPIHRTYNPDIVDKVRVDIGTSEKLIPLNWVVGRSAEVDDVDQPRPSLTPNV